MVYPKPYSIYLRGTINLSYSGVYSKGAPTRLVLGFLPTRPASGLGLRGSGFNGLEVFGFRVWGAKG